MKVLLISPPNHNELLGCDPIVIKDSQGTSPPLGILYIASYVREHTNHEVAVIDSVADDLDYSELAMRVEAEDPDVIGMTVMTFTLIDVKLSIDAIRRRGIRAKIILGGPHPTIYPKETLEAFNCDYVVVGEGEETMVKLLENLDSSQRIWYSDGFIQDLDTLPFPARDLTPIGKYCSVLAKESPTTTMFSSRGCPFHCTFCDRPALGKNFRAMSAKRVVDEMEHCVNLGIKEIFFYDDTFTVSIKRVEEICNMILERGLKISWDIRTRVNVVTEPLIRSMKEAGCVRIHFGVESAIPRVLKELNKGITPEQVENAFRICKDYDIKTLGYFILGNPTETHKDIRATVELAKKLNPDYMQCSILTPFPATKLYERALSTGLIKSDVWREYARNPDPSFKVPFWTENFTREELERERRWFYKSFYLNPSYIWNTALQVRSLAQFNRYAKAGLSLIKMVLNPSW